jgi:hypothetical protein
VSVGGASLFRESILRCWTLYFSDRYQCSSSLIQSPSHDISQNPRRQMWHSLRQRLLDMMLKVGCQELRAKRGEGGSFAWRQRYFRKISLFRTILHYKGFLSLGNSSAWVGNGHSL